MRLNKSLMIFALAVFSPLLLAQQSDKTLFFIGHSLVNLNMPAIVHGLAMDAGVGRENDYNTQMINGAPLR